ncbi:hypothetical protein, partial [Phocaeicola coprophilus]
KATTKPQSVKGAFLRMLTVRTGLTEFLITTEIQPVIKIFQEKHPVLHLPHFYIFPIGICLVPTQQIY